MGLAEGQDVGGGAVTWKLLWGCRICFLDGARTWPFFTTRTSAKAARVSSQHDGKLSEST